MTLKKFIEGMGSVMNLYSDIPPKTDFNVSAETDEEAIRSDWQVVGDDLRNSMNSIGTLADNERRK